MKRRAPRKKKSVFAKHKFGSILIGLFIISIMVLSAMNMWEEEDTESFSYSGVEFTKTDRGYVTFIGDRPIVVSNNPVELENNFTIPTSNPEFLNNMGKVYISYDHLVETRRGVQTFFKNYALTPHVVDACPEDNDICRDLPLRDCDHAKDGVGVLLFKVDNESKVFYENSNCLVIQGKDLSKVVDKLMLEVLL